MFKNLFFLKPRIGRSLHYSTESKVPRIEGCSTTRRNRRLLQETHKHLTAGVLGSGYLLYKLYNAHRQRLGDLEREPESDRQNDELIKAQMQAHFDSIQRIADTTTLPHAMRYLNSRIMEELDVYHLMERLMQGKDQPNPLTSAEKIDLWDRLKILKLYENGVVTVVNDNP